MVCCLQILFITGLTFVIGLERTFRFFFQKHKVKGTTFFFGGIFVVLVGWPVVGMIVEMYGFFLLFRYDFLHHSLLVDVRLHLLICAFNCDKHCPPCKQEHLQIPNFVPHNLLSHCKIIVACVINDCICMWYHIAQNVAIVSVYCIGKFCVVASPKLLRLFWQTHSLLSFSSVCFWVQYYCTLDLVSIETGNRHLSESKLFLVYKLSLVILP